MSKKTSLAKNTLRYIREVLIGIFSVSLIVFFIGVFALCATFFCWLGHAIFDLINDYIIYLWYGTGGALAACILIGVFFPKRIIEIMEG